MWVRDLCLETGRTAGPSATPDFLLILMALADFMRFSPTENRTRGCIQCSVAGNPGPLGMTILFEILRVCSQVKLSSRPERTDLLCAFPERNCLHEISELC